MTDLVIRPRSSWTSTGFGFARLSNRHLDKTKVRTLAPHFPAAGDVTYANPTIAQTAQRLRNWRRQHVEENGWPDIGYNFAIDQKGNVFTCAGASYAAAHASRNNFTALGVLFIVGDNERPSAAARAAFRALGKWLREEYGFPNLVAVMDHGRLPGESSECAGTLIRADINAGNLSITGGAPSSSDSDSSGGSSSSGGSTPSTSGKSVTELAREVIDGKHGNGAARQASLGDQYAAVQAEVNRILSGNSGSTSAPSSSRPSLSQVARRVINGEFGNEPQRSQRLRAAGFDPSQVQAEVNRLLGVQARPAPSPSQPAQSSSGSSLTAVAQRVINGEFGNEPQRSNRLRAQGFNPTQVQREVNRILSGGSTSSSSKSTNTIAREVINGKWGNDPQRSQRLRAAGYNPTTIQNAVNRLLG